jgi:ribonuclease HI
MILRDPQMGSEARDVRLFPMFEYGSMNIVIYCDGSGGSNGDNGGWGFSAQSEKGNILYEEFGPPDGFSTNNISEYRAVIYALRWAKGKTAGTISIRTDSTLVVEQCLNRWKCKKPHLKPLQQEARDLLYNARAVIEWVPREQNKRADELSHAWEHPNEYSGFKENREGSDGRIYWSSNAVLLH